jgi:hypothetical protein
LRLETERTKAQDRRNVTFGAFCWSKLHKTNLDLKHEVEKTKTHIMIEVTTKSHKKGQVQRMKNWSHVCKKSTICRNTERKRKS